MVQLQENMFDLPRLDCPDCVLQVFPIVNGLANVPISRQKNIILCRTTHKGEADMVVDFSYSTLNPTIRLVLQVASRMSKGTPGSCLAALMTKDVLHLPH